MFQHLPRIRISQGYELDDPTATLNILSRDEDGGRSQLVYRSVHDEFAAELEGNRADFAIFGEQ